MCLERRRIVTLRNENGLAHAIRAEDCCKTTGMARYITYYIPSACQEAKHVVHVCVLVLEASHFGEAKMAAEQLFWVSPQVRDQRLSLET